jgi:hypothetical protein
VSVLKTKDAACILGQFLRVNYCAIKEKATLQALRVIVVENKGCYQTVSVLRL